MVSCVVNDFSNGHTVVCPFPNLWPSTSVSIYCMSYCCFRSRLGCQIQLTQDLDGLEVTIPATVNDARS